MTKTVGRFIHGLVRIILILSLVTGAAYGAWWFMNRPVQEKAEWDGAIKSFSFAPYQKDQNPLKHSYPTPEQIDQDLKFIKDYGHGVRTYSSLDNQEYVPSLAKKYSLKVMMGAWIQNVPRDKEEIDSLVDLINKNKNITGAFVGNEVLLRGEKTADEMIAMIKDVKKRTAKRKVPISTADIWQTWAKHPELVDAVDFIAVHVLPYWEGVPADQAIDYVFKRYDELKALYPNKRIVLAEVGWPSMGPWMMGAEPSLVNQAKFIRGFLNEAQARNIDYTIMEAFDQPWKYGLEGPVGTAWGIFNADRQIKFQMVGALQENDEWADQFGWAVLLAVPFMLLFMMLRRDVRFMGQLIFSALIMGFASLIVMTVVQVATEALLLSIGIAWSVLVFAQVIMVMVTLFDGFEMTEMLWKRDWIRRVHPGRDSDDQNYKPKVSIHVPCYNEPPEMVKLTLDHLAALNYPNFEVLIIDNNTKDEAVWKPVEDYCAQLGARFRFYHLPSWPGFKAGALNFALKETAADAEIIAVIDSDYTVSPDWLSAMAPYFKDEKVGLVQSPQAYREWRGSRFKSMCNWEYAGFFHIGMVQRNERNAIIQHGTMTLIRRTAMDQQQGWAEWCITEDAELGLRLLEQGWQSVYSPEPFGYGVVPDSFAAYKSQRFRWAYGAMQILKKHWKELLPGSKKLNSGQKFHFVAGWLPWLADAANVIFAAASLFWSVGVMIVPKIFGFPPTMFMIPTIAAFVAKLCFSYWLYVRCVPCTFKERAGAAIAGMALTYTVGRAILQGLVTSSKPFIRTPKYENRPALAQGFLMARDETILLLSLIGLAIAIPTFASWANHEAVMWSLLLTIQALPFAASVYTSLANIVPEKKQKGGEPIILQPVPEAVIVTDMPEPALAPALALQAAS